MIEHQFPEPLVSNARKGHWAVKAEPSVKLFDLEIQGTVFVGFGSYMNQGQIRSYGEIGRYCSIGRGVSIGLGHHDKTLPSTSSFFTVQEPTRATLKLASENPKRRVIIGHDVWIGDGVRIDSGVTVGHGSIIATGAVVTRDVEPYSIVGGLPAKFLKWRFEKSVREILLESRWWDFDPGVLREIFCPDPELFVNRLREATPRRYPQNYRTIIPD